MRAIGKHLPWIFAILWLGIRVLAAQVIYFGDPDKARTVGVMLNLLFIIVLIFIVLMDLYKLRRMGHKDSFIGDLKNVAFPCVKYVLGVGILLAVYYNVISDELLQKRKADYQLTIEALDTDEELKAVRSQNIQLEKLSREEIIDAANKRTDLFTSPKVVSSASFVVLVFVTLIYAVFAVFLFRSFLKMR